MTLLLSLAFNFSQWPLVVLQWKIPCGPKSSYIEHNCKLEDASRYKHGYLLLFEIGLIFVRPFQSTEGESKCCVLRLVSIPHLGYSINTHVQWAAYL